MRKQRLPDHLNNSKLFELVKTYQVHAHARNCWKYNNNECCFYYGQYVTEKAVIVKPLVSKFSNDEKQGILKEVKRYIDNNFNPEKLNVIHPTKDIFTQPLSVREILYV